MANIMMTTTDNRDFLLVRTMMVTPMLVTMRTTKVLLHQQVQSEGKRKQNRGTYYLMKLMIMRFGSWRGLTMGAFDGVLEGLMKAFGNAHERSWDDW